MRRRWCSTLVAVLMLTSALSVAGAIVTSTPAVADTPGSGGVGDYYGLVQLNGVAALNFNQEAVSSNGEWVLSEVAVQGGGYWLSQISQTPDQTPHLVGSTELTTQAQVSAAESEYGLTLQDVFGSLPDEPSVGPACGTSISNAEDPAGTVVGTTTSIDDGQYLGNGSEDVCGAFVYSPQTGTELLSNLMGNANFDAYNAWGISDEGDVVGDGFQNGDAAFAYLAYPTELPSVSSVSPSPGPTSGGEKVTIDGSYFNTLAGGTSFSFGGVDASNVKCTTLEVCTATVPGSQSDGTVSVSATTQVGQSSADGEYTYSSNPIVRSVTPGAGPLTGNTPITIQGVGFTGATAVTFHLADGDAITIPISLSQVVGDVEIDGVVTPDVSDQADGQPEVVSHISVTAENGEGINGSAGDQFIFGTPDIKSIDHDSGPGNGGDTLNVCGSGFTQGSQVLFNLQDGNGDQPDGTVTNVESDGSCLTVTTPDVTAYLANNEVSSLLSEVQVATPAGLSPINPQVDGYTFGCQQQTDLSDGEWAAQGCFSADADQTDFQGSQQENPSGFSLSGLTVTPPSSTPADLDVDGASGDTASLPAGTTLGLNLGVSGGVAQFFNGQDVLNLTGVPQKITVAANSVIAGFPISGSMTFNPQQGNLSGTVQTVLPPILGGGKANMKFTTSLSKGLTSLEVDADQASLGNLFAVSGVKITWSQGQGWTFSGTVTRAGQTVPVNGTLVYTNNQLTSGHIEVDNVSLAGLLQINKFVLDFNSQQGWSGSASIAQGTSGGSIQNAGVSFAFNSAGQMTSGSLQTGAVSLFGVIPLDSFDLKYNNSNGGSWTLAVQSTLANSAQVNVTLNVVGGAIKGAGFELQNVTLLGKNGITLNDLNLTYAATNNTYTATVKATLPAKFPVTGLDGEIVFANGTFKSGKLTLSGSVPIADGAFLTSLGAAIQLSPFVISGSATVSLGPQSASFGSVTGTLTYSAASNGTPETIDVNGQAESPIAAKLLGGKGVLGNGDVNINTTGQGTFCVALGGGSAAAASGGGSSCSGSTGLAVKTKFASAKLTGSLSGSFDINGNLQASGTTAISGAITAFGQNIPWNPPAGTMAISSATGLAVCAGSVGFTYTWATASLNTFLPPFTGTQTCTTAGFGGTATAQDPPLPPAETTAAPGGSVNLTGTGFLPGEPVMITLDSLSSLLAVGTADGNGDVAATVTIPPGTSPGQHQFILTGEMSLISATVDVYVTTAGGTAGAPVFTSTTPPSTLTAGGDYSYQFAVSSPTDAPGFTLDPSAPSWLSIDPVTGMVSGTEPGDGEGAFTYSVLATNDEGTATAGPFTVTVLNPPSFGADAPPLTTESGQPYLYQFQATGTPDAPVYSLGADAPTWLSIDAASGAVSGTEPGNEGFFSYSVTATDNEGSTTVGPFIVLVASYEAPTWAADSPPLSAPDAVPYSYQFVAEGSPDPTYTLDPASPAWLAVDPDTGIVTGTPPVGTTTFSYGVTAGNTDFSGNPSALDSGEFTVNVGGPSFQADSPPDSVVAGSAYDYSFQAEDPGNQNDQVTYSLDPNAPSWLSIDPNYGNVWGTPPGNGTTEFTYQVIATDADGSTTAGPFSVDVQPYTAPSWTAETPPTVTTAGDSYTYQFQASGAPAPTYSIAGSVDGSTPAPSWLSIDPNTGIVSGTPPAGTATFSYTVFAANDGFYPTVSSQIVDDGGLITVDVTNPPVFTQETPPLSVAAGATYSAEFQAAGTPAPSYSLDPSSPSWLSIDPLTGVLTGTEPQNGETSFTFSVIATSAEGSITAGPYLISVTPDAVAPQFTEAYPPLTTGSSGTYAYTFVATSLPDPPVLGLAAGAPAWLSINATTGALSGSPPSGLSSFTYAVVATSAGGSQSVGPFVVDVVPSSPPAIVNAHPSLTVGVGSPYAYTFASTGSPVPKFSLESGAPAWLSIDPDSGELTGTPPSGSASTYPIAVDASNGISPRATYSFTLSVVDVPAAPGGVTATAGVGSATISWSAPPAGVSPVTGYLITTSPGGQSVVAGSTATQATFDGLSSGVAYTFSVAATSVAGDGASLTSNPVVPTAVGEAGLASGTSGSSNGIAVAGPVSSSSVTMTADGEGVGTIGVGTYPSDPVDDLGGETSFFDVATGPGSDFGVVDLTACGAVAGDDLEWWNPTDAAFELVGGQSAVSAGGCITDTINQLSTPGIADLYGTIFAVSVPSPTLTTSSLPDATAGAPFQKQIGANGGAGTLSFSSSGLPSWLSLSPTGELSGTPSLADVGSIGFTVTVTDGNGVSSQPQDLNLNIDMPPSISVTSVGDASVGGDLNEPIDSSGGAYPLTFSSTDLPTWLSLSASGVLTGTPSVADEGPSTFTAVVTDANGVASAPQQISLNVDGPPSIPISSLPPGVVGQFYDQQVPGNGFTNTGSLIYSSTDLPSWLSLTPSGELEGLPPSAGQVTVDVVVTDSNGVSSAPTPLTIDVTPPAPAVALQVNPGSTTFGMENDVSMDAVVTGGLLGPIPTGSVTVSDTSGVLCTIALSAGEGSCNLGVESIPVGTDSTIVANYGGDGNYSAAASTQQSLSVSPGTPAAITITSPGATTMFTGSSSSFSVTTSGFPLPTLSEAGTLPAGVTFVDQSDGTALLSGTPQSGTAGTYPLTVQATNGTGPAITQSFLLTIVAPLEITSAPEATFNAQQAGSFTVTTSGSSPSTTVFATPTVVGQIGLPSWATFTDNGNGTATISATPPLALGSPGYGGDGPSTFTITAYDGVSPPVSQIFTLTDDEAPYWTTASNGVATGSGDVGSTNTFTFFAAGYPVPTLSLESALPTGFTLALDADNDGGGTITASPQVPAGIYQFTLLATSSEGSSTEVLTLTIGGPTALTSAGAATFVAGTGGAFTVTTASSVPAASLTEVGSLPSGVTFTDNGNGTATIAVSPSAPAGTTQFTIDGSNQFSSPTQTFTLTVSSLPLQSIAFTSTSPTNALSGGATYTPTAVATSGLPVTFSIDSSSGEGVCSVSDGVVSFSAVGSCVIDADQSGDDQLRAGRRDPTNCVGRPSDPDDHIHVSTSHRCGEWGAALHAERHRRSLRQPSLWQ